MVWQSRGDCLRCLGKSLRQLTQSHRLSKRYRLNDQAVFVGNFEALTVTAGTSVVHDFTCRHSCVEHRVTERWKLEPEWIDLVERTIPEMKIVAWHRRQTPIVRQGSEDALNGEIKIATSRRR